MPRTTTTPTTIIIIIIIAAVVAAASACCTSAHELRSNNKDIPRYPRTGVPIDTTMTAPWTPFKNEPPLFPVNYDVLPAYVESIAKEFSATGGGGSYWIGGGMSQFETQTTADRIKVGAITAPILKQYGVFSIFHLGTTVRADAMEMAAAAKQFGADSISSVPPYYEHCGTAQCLVDYFVPIVNASGNLPFFIYDIPGETHSKVPMSEFVPLAAAQIDKFAGVKYVEDDSHQYMDLVAEFGDRIAFWFAPEPKLRSFPLGATGFVLAESFYAATLNRMAAHFIASNFSAALKEQQWKYSVDACFSKFGSSRTNAKRALYRRLAGVDIGPDRPPKNSVPLTATEFTGLCGCLDQYGFFEQKNPGVQPLSKLNIH